MFLILAACLVTTPDEPPLCAVPPRTAVKAAPVVREVTTVRTFRNGSYHAGHACPVCNRTQFVIDSGRKYGTHTHRCQFDGTVWTH